MFGKKWFEAIKAQWRISRTIMKEKPWQFASIPIAAGAVGYVTNLVGVNMLFYPIEYTGLNIRRWPENPFGILGWQGIVPCKRVEMATTCVDVTLTRLLTIEEVFGRLDPQRMASLLSPELSKVVMGGWAPLPVVEYFVQQVATEVIRNIEKLVSCRNVMVRGMSDDPRTLGNFFQKVGEKELTFLVQSGTYFGFLLGLGQMAQLMAFPALWTLPVCGAVVGLLTNWIAIALIFKPVKPVEIGSYSVQGLFLKRQREVSAEVSSYLAAEVLTSQDIWREILTGPNKDKFADIIRHKMPFLTDSMVAAVVGSLEEQLLLRAEKFIPPAKSQSGRRPKLKSTNIKGITVIIPPPIIDPHPEVLEVVTKIVPDPPVPTPASAPEKAAEPMPAVQLKLQALTRSLRIHPLHTYINGTLQVETTLIERLELLTAAEFERLLHPIFEEDELTLILAGGVLGMIAGGMQWWFNVMIDSKLLVKKNVVRTAGRVARKVILRR